MTMIRRLVGEGSKVIRTAKSTQRLVSASMPVTRDASSAATSAAAAAKPPSTVNAASASQLSSSTDAQDKNVNAFFLVSRLPTILPTPTPFESAFYAYNAKIERALAQPFPRELYFKKGSAAETQFLREEAERQKLFQRSTDAGKGDATSSSHPQPAAAASVVSIQGDTEALQSRKTKADEAKDVRSLERSLDKTLFLVVRDSSSKESGDKWTLPQTQISQSGSESLHNAVRTSLHAQLGEDMDIWMVTNMPVGSIGRLSKTASPTSPAGYVMRAHITAGSPKPTKKGVDYAWLTREEMEKQVDSSVYEELKDLLSA